MKTLIRLTLFLLTTGILSTSCSRTSLSLTKRHYRSGYYVDYKSKHVAPKTAEVAKHNVSTPPATVATIDKKPSFTITENASPANDINTDKQDTKESKFATQPKIASPSVPAASILNNPAPFVFSVMQNAKYDNSTKATQDDGGERALSLFWTVILLVIILWLIGVLTGGWGLGILINLLLVIALILLVLWLLRIV